MPPYANPEVVELGTHVVTWEQQKGKSKSAFISLTKSTQNSQITMDDPVLDDNASDLPLVDIPIGPKLVEETPTEVSVSDESLLNDIGEEENPHTPPSFFERLLDCNPCAIKIGSPTSALLKVRICAECGDRVHKFRGGGYEKEYHLNTITDDDIHEESEVGTKVYFHGDCLKRRENRTIHRESGFGNVLTELQDTAKAMNWRKRRARRSQAKSAAAAAAAVPLKHVLKGPKQSFPKRVRRALKSFSLKSCRRTQDATMDDSSMETATHQI